MIVNAQGHEINGNGADVTERQRQKLLAQNATLHEANEIAHMHAVQAVNHLGNQIPGLVHSIVKAAIQGYHASLIELGVIPANAPIGQYVNGPVTPQGAVAPVPAIAVPGNAGGDQPTADAGQTAPVTFCESEP